MLAGGTDGDKRGSDRHDAPAEPRRRGGARRPRAGRARRHGRDGLRRRAATAGRWRSAPTPVSSSTPAGCRSTTARWRRPRQAAPARAATPATASTWPGRVVVSTSVPGPRSPVLRPADLGRVAGRGQPGRRGGARGCGLPRDRSGRGRSCRRRPALSSVDAGDRSAEESASDEAQRGSGERSERSARRGKRQRRGSASEAREAQRRRGKRQRRGAARLGRSEAKPMPSRQTRLRSAR